MTHKERVTGDSEPDSATVPGTLALAPVAVFGKGDPFSHTRWDFSA